MSTFRLWHLECDRCHRELDSAQTIGELRRIANLAGWERVRGTKGSLGLDLCATCSGNNRG